MTKENPRFAYAGTNMHMYAQVYICNKGSRNIKKAIPNLYFWNESNIIWEPFQTSIFQLYKALHGTFSKHTEIPWEKPKIHWKPMNQKGVFHKAPSSQFYLSETFSGPHPFILTLLITFLLVCE